MDITDLTGRWLFTEEFEYGTDRGIARLTHRGDMLEAIFEYEEAIEGASPFWVKQRFVGRVEGNKVFLHGVEVTDTDGNTIPDYHYDTLEGTFTREGKIVGHSFDSEDVCGVFVLTPDCSK